LTSAVAHVTIEICGALGTSDSTLGTYLRPCRDPFVHGSASAPASRVTDSWPDTRWLSKTVGGLSLS
jgi:hypothetical protein